MSEELCWKSAAELADLYRRRETSPVEVVEAVLDRLEKVNPEINAFVTITADEARNSARLAEKRLASGEELPELFGVPITVKDLTDTAGVRTTYGCVAYSDYIPDEDALAWARLKAAGTILIGKTTTCEFGLLGVTESKLTGSTGTPWDPTRTSGGSSGGAASATAAGIAPLAWGSDGGGSIRVPASLCGVVGVKPSIGRIPHAENTDTDSTEGPIARTVLDAALLLDATVGQHPGDRISVPHSGESFAAAARQDGDLSGLRIAAVHDLGQQVLDPQVRSVFDTALEDMRSAGATVECAEISLPDTQEFFAHFNGPEYASYVDEMRAAGLDIWPLVADFAERGRSVSGQQASRAARQGKTDIYNAFTGVLDGFDFMVTPTTPTPAFPHAGDYGPPGHFEGQDVPALGVFLHSMTEPPSHAGLPAISVLGGFTPGGLPVGLQFIGRMYEDASVISCAARYERATAWNLRRPLTS